MTKKDSPQTVQMRLKPHTLEVIEQMKDKMHTDNRTEVVRNAIEITNTILDTMKSGGEVIFEKTDGSRTKLVLQHSA